MVRLFFLLGGFAVLAAGPLSSQPLPITSAQVKAPQIIAVSASADRATWGALLQQ